MVIITGIPPDNDGSDGYGDGYGDGSGNGFGHGSGDGAGADIVPQRETEDIAKYYHAITEIAGQ